MPSQQEVRWSQLKVGVIVLVAAIVLTTLLFLMTSSSGMGITSKKLEVTTYFENAAGLKEGAPVNLQGVTIGAVRSVRIVAAKNPTPVQVIMRIDSKYLAGLKKDSKAALTTVGVLGDTVVDINSQFATQGTLQDGDELRTLETPSIQDVVKASQGTIETLNVILAKMNALVDNMQSGKGSIGQLINNPDLYNKVNASVDELHKLTVNLNAGKGSVGKLLTDDEAYNRLNSAVAKLNDLISSLQSGKGTAGKLLTDDKLYNNLNKTLEQANGLMTDARSGKGSVAMLLNDPKFRDQVTETVTQLNTVVSNVNAGKGTLGKLTTDDAAYTNLNSLLTESTRLVTTIRSDPKKYLTIHLKIF